ncbi:MAG: hypothetical protein AAF447_18405 [Myxococcota bacterium]
MSGTSPVSSSPVSSSRPPAGPPAPPPDPSPAAVVDDAAARIDRTQRVHRPRRGHVALDAAMRGARSAYDAHGRIGLQQWLARPSNRAAAALLATTSESVLEAGGLGSSARDVVGDVAVSRARFLLVRRANEAVGEQVRGLSQLLVDPEASVTTLREAAPGTPEAELAERLGLRGDAGDVRRLESGVEQAIVGLRRFQTAIHGQSWDNAEFPRGIAASVREMTRGRPLPADSPLAEGLETTDLWNTVTDGVSTVLEVVQLGREGAQIAHHLATGARLAAGTGMALAVIGLSIGLGLHHLAEDAHDDIYDVGKALLGEVPEAER